MVGESFAAVKRLLRAVVLILVPALFHDPGTLAGQSRPTARPPAGLDLYMPVPPGINTSPGAVALGRRIFFDPVLSRDSTLACASCHQPERAFANGREKSVGVGGRQGIRNVPTLINRGWGEVFFWDGRIEQLEEQVLQPIIAPTEMDMTLEAVVERLGDDPTYQTSFRRVFGAGVGRERLAAALTAYVRSIRAGNSPFDRAVEGVEDALSELERRGLQLFQGRARCDRCHLGALLTDESFHNTGVAWREGVPVDRGRAEVTGRPEDVGAFKTPTLRELDRTAPYMHDGSLATLEDVVDFYDRGGHPNPFLDPAIRPLGLTEEDKGALVAFLHALAGRIEEG